MSVYWQMDHASPTAFAADSRLGVAGALRAHSSSRNLLCLALTGATGGPASLHSVALHDLLHDLSIRTFDRLTLARTGGWELREETVTEDLLLALMEHPAAETRVFKSSIGDENRLGLDWLWSIQTAGHWLTMWVQAKKGTGTAFVRYDGLKGAANELQSIRLLINAHNQNAIPVYAFFNPRCAPFQPATSISFGACTRGEVLSCATGLPWEPDPPHPGCSRAGVTLADAVDVAVKAVFSDQAGRRNATTVNDYAMPWECLVCPMRATAQPVLPPGPGPDGPPGGPADTGGEPGGLPLAPRLLRAVEYLRHASGDDGGVVLPGEPFGVTTEAPTWVSRLQAQGVPFEPSLTQPSLTEPGDLALPHYYVVTVDHGQDQEPGLEP